MPRTPALLSALAAASLLLIASLRITATYSVLSHTIDEPAHLGAGMEWLQAHRYTFEDQHPPLARIAGALGLEFAGIHWTGGRTLWEEGYRLLGSGDHYNRALSSARLAMLPFFWLAAGVVYLWTLRLAGPLAAFFSTLLYTALPPVLAHAGLATTDMAVAATTSLALFVSTLWWQHPTWRWNLLFGLALALAILSKFSSLVFLPAAWLLIALTAPRPIATRAPLKPIACVLATAFLITWAAYLFTFHRVDFLHLPLPAPAFFNGLATVWRHNLTGHRSYLLGTVSTSGFWFYYPVVLALKTPLAIFVLLVPAAVAAFRKRDPWNLRLPLAIGLAILLVGAFSRINIGVRHILPIYTGLAIAAGIAAARLWTGRRAPAFIALLAWFLISGARHHPEYLAYMNELAIGPPEHYLVDSDLDWMQDMRLLAAHLKQNRIDRIWVNWDPAITQPVGLPETCPLLDYTTQPEGWTAISLTAWKLGPTDSWIDKTKPTTSVGRAIHLYYRKPKPAN